MISRIHIVGAGGIGSYLCKGLAEAIKQNQIRKSIVIHVYDPDEVEEKNIMYQDFEDIDITDYKVNVMRDRYSFIGHNKRVGRELLKTLGKDDLIVCCVDNATFRREMFEELGDPDKAATFLDLRSEGRFIAWYTKSKKFTKDELLKTVGENSEDSSCQLPYRFAEQIIDNGNKIIAEIGVQLVLNILRSESFATHKTMMI